MTRERRAAPRVAPVSGSALEHARLRPGKTARVVNLSCGGALLETEWRLLPGTHIEVHIGEIKAPQRTGGRILRCQVATLRRDRIAFHGALAFDPPLPAWVVMTQAERLWNLSVLSVQR